MSFAAQFVTGIDANRTIKDELSEAIHSGRGRRRLSVTDLLNPRQAFFRWTRPEIRPSPDRLKLMLSGTGVHEIFGRTVSTEEFVEQFIESEAIVGKIDIYKNMPVELKTTNKIPSNILLDRPGYADQLGMYCAMTNKPKGLLVLYRRAFFGNAPVIKAFDIEFTQLGHIMAEMLRRRHLLEAAIANGDPAELPQCEWFSRGCDYRDCCGCESLHAAGRIVPLESMRVSENTRIADVIRERFDYRPEIPSGFRLNDLVFPRKAALEYAPTDDDTEDEDTNVEANLASMESQGLRGALYQAMRFGCPGSFARTAVSIRTLKGWVATYKGVPTLLRTTKFPTMVERHRLPETLTHYFDRLAFECALTGQEQGRLLLYYEALPGDKFMVYDVWFKDLSAIVAEAERRLELLENAAPAHQLPACPGWMSKFCRFAPGCGCAVHRP
jgi:hypothetical protein